MARSKKVTETGPVGLRGIRGTDLYNDITTRAANNDEAALNYINTMNSFRHSSPGMMSDFDNTKYFQPQEVDDPAWNIMGKSKYDRPFQVGGTPTDIQENRADSQSAALKLTNGILKGVVTAGTTFADGTLGLLYGLGTGIYNLAHGEGGRGFLRGFYDNDISNALRGINKAMEEILPNYMTQDEIENPWALRNIFSANTIGNEFLKNIGFAVGAFYSGSAWNAALKSIGLLKGAIASQTIGAALSGFNEGRVEAGNLYEEMVETELRNLNQEKERILQERYGSPEAQALFQNINANYERKRAAIEAEPDTTSTIDGAVVSNKQQKLMALAREREMSIQSLKNSLSADVDKRFKNMEIDIHRRASLAANADLLFNTMYLPWENMYAFGKLYSRGFRVKKDLGTRATKKAAQAIEESAERATRAGRRAESVLDRAGRQAEAAETVGERITRNAADATEAYGFNPVKTGKAAWRGIKTGLGEGAEEINQGFFSSTASNMYQPDSPDAYYQALLNDDYEVKTKDNMTAISEGIADSWGNSDTWKEGLIGFMTGIIGMPTFGKVQNAGPNTYLGRGKAIGLSGGIFGEISTAAYLNQQAKSAVTTMNKFMKNVNDAKEIITRSQAFSDAMDGYSVADDKFEFKNAKDNDLFNVIDAFSRTGRLDELREIIGQDFENMSDERLQDIIDKCSDDEKNEWLDGSGQPFTATEQGKQEMREKLIKKRDAILGSIESYEDALVEMIAIGNNALSDDQVRELAWLKWKQQAFEDRFDSIKKDRQDVIVDLANSVEIFLRGRGREAIDEETEEGRIIIRNMETLKGFLQDVSEAEKPLQFAKMLKINPGLLRFLEEEGFPLLSGITSADASTFRETMRDIRDMTSIATAADTFNERLKEFIENPMKLIQNRERMRQQHETQQAAVNQATAQDTVRNSTVAQLGQQVDNGELDMSQLEDIFGDDPQAEVAEATQLAAQQASGQQATDNQPTELTPAQKLAEVQKIRKSHARATRAIDAALQRGDITQQQATDAKRMLDRARQTANSNDEFLNMGTQSYMDSNVFTEGEQFDQSLTDDQIRAQVGQRLDEARNTLNRIFTEMANSDEALSDIPDDSQGSASTAPPATDHGTTGGTDPTDRVPSTQEQREAREREEQARASALQAHQENKELAERIVTSHLRNSVNRAIYDKIVEDLTDILDSMDYLLDRGVPPQMIAASIQGFNTYDDLAANVNNQGILENMLNEALSTKLGQRAQSSQGQQPQTNQQQQGAQQGQGQQPHGTQAATETQPTHPDGEESYEAPTGSQDALQQATTQQFTQNPSNNDEREAEQMQYWKPTTTELPITPVKGDTTPFWETVDSIVGADGLPKYSEAARKRIEAVGRYLQRVHAFEVVNQGLPIGSEIGFIVDPQLNEEAGEIVILMVDSQGRVVGDVMSKLSPRVGQQVGLKEFIEKCEREYEQKRQSDNTGAVIKLDAKTHVRQNLIGKVVYLPASQGLQPMSNLGRGLKLGISMNTGRNAVIRTGSSTRNSGQTQEEKSIYPPLDAVQGKPYILVETSDTTGRKKYMCVPFIMKPFDGTANTALGRAIARVLGQIKNSNNSEVVRTILALQELLYIPEMHINYSPDGSTVKVTIKQKGAEHQRTIYNGPTNADNLVDQLMQALQGQSLSVSRKYINRQYNGVDYNSMIAEVGETDLASLHTISDWFTVNPIDGNGQELRGGRVPNLGSNPQARSQTPQNSEESVNWNGTELIINTTTWEVRNASTGQVYEGENVNRLRAKKFGLVKDKDMSQPYDTPWGRFDPTTNRFAAQQPRPQGTVVMSFSPQQARTAAYDFTNAELWENIDVDLLSDEQLLELEAILNGALATGVIRNTQLTAEQKQNGEKLKSKVEGKLASINTIQSQSSTTSTTQADTQPAVQGTQAQPTADTTQPAQQATQPIEEDPLLETAKEMAQEMANRGEYLYTSLLQRFHRIGYNRAMKIMDRLEELGYPLKRGTRIVNAPGQQGAATTTATSSTSNNPLLGKSTDELTEIANQAGILNNSRKKKVWNVLTADQMAYILNMDALLLDMWLDNIVFAYDRATGTIDESKLSDAIRYTLFGGESPRFRRQEKTSLPKWNPRQEMAWLQKVLPNLSSRDAVRIVNGLIRITDDPNPGLAYGRFMQGLIEIGSDAARGTLYHEAFHAVVNALMEKSERDTMFSEAAKYYGMKAETNKEILEVEEKLAEDFRLYVQKEDTPIIGTIRRFFRMLKHIWQTFRGNEPYLTKLFYDINRGKYGQRKVNETDAVRQAKEQYTEEQQRILDNAPRDAQGRLLAPNGNVSNLNERQYVHVRTKAFKDWFGDWENDPENASKVVDENGEPMVVYHGSKSKTRIDYFKIGNDLLWDIPRGAFFTTDRDYATKYSGWLGEENIYEVFLNIREPEYATQGIDYENAVAALLYSNNQIDGVIGHDTGREEETSSNEFVIYDAHQVKSATENIGTYSTKNPDIRYRRVEQEEVEKQLTEDVEAFLSNFGITLNDVSNYDGELPLFDAINRVINFTSIDDITDGVGEAVAFMMQHQKPVRDLISLYINDPKGFRRQGRKKGDIKMPKIPKGADTSGALKAIGKEIANELRKLYNLDEKPSLASRIWDVITSFFNFLNSGNRVKFAAIREFTQHIANDIKLNDKSLIIRGMVKPGTTTTAERVNISKAFEENPYEESIISYLSERGIALAGSASIALHGTVYRPKENPLHDIDFNAAGFSREELDDMVNGISKHNTHVRTITSEGSLTETYLVMDREYTVEQNGFHEEKNDKGKVKRTPLYELKDKNGNIIGRYYNSELTLAEGVKGKFLDFFRQKSTYGSSSMEINGKRYLISDPRNAWQAKVKWARLKDIWDYNRYMPDGFQVYTVKDDINKTRQEISERIAKSNIIWGHPALGKTTYIREHQDEVLEWDEEVNPKRNEFIRDQIDPAHVMDTESQEYKDAKSEYAANAFDHPEYIAFLTREWQALKERAQREGKKLFASPLPLLQLFMSDFDLVVNLSEYEFMQRNMGRGQGFYGSLSWKEAIDRTLQKVERERLVTTDSYFSDIMKDEKVRRQIRSDKLMYGNLSQEDREYIQERGLSIEEYNQMSDEEKEVFLHCKL